MLPENEIPIIDKIINATNSIQVEPIGEIRARLVFLINELLRTDFHALVQLLYRIDVDEKKLKELLEANAGIDSASIIAALIISRQLEKIATKKQYGPGQDPGADDSW